MSIDWITVAAQIANFLVLVWLLKRFLYRPILDGIDAREAEISERMNEAARASDKAAAAEAEYHGQLASFRADQSTMTDNTRFTAEAERDALLVKAKDRMVAERKIWDAHLEEEGRKYIAELHQAGAKTLLSLTRKALSDLADETLEDRIVAHVVNRLRPMAADLRQSAGSADEAVASTRDLLAPEARKRLTADLADIIPNMPLRFETDPAQAPGLILHIGGAQVSWTVDSYIEGLDALLQEQLAAGPNAKVAGDGN